MKATEQYFHVVLFIWCYARLKPWHVTIDMKATAQYFHVILFI